MSKNDIMALDKSVRSKSVDGHLFIEVSPISKACVSPYFGKEIPNGEALGLDPDKIYMLLRCPIELAKAADSFRGKPVLIIHKPSMADDHPQELTVGALGDSIEFNDPYLEAPMSIWVDEAIVGIETKIQTEISSGYFYTADMTPGTYKGEAYDGVMRNIQGNHVALVEVGRAGPDVVVMDAKPSTLELKTMAKTTPVRLSRIAAAVNVALRTFLTPRLAQDAALGSTGALVGDVKAATLVKQTPGIVQRVTAHMASVKLAKDANLDGLKEALDAVVDDPDLAEDEDDEDDKDKPKGANDVEPDDPAKVGNRAAMDAATITATATAAAIKANNELHQARKDVESLVGEIALDSAEAVYRFALDKAGINVEGVHASAFRALVESEKSRKNAAAQNTTPMGMDAASVKQVAEQFPGLARIKKA